MKKVNLFIVSLVAVVTLSVGLSSCGGGSGNSNSNSNNTNEQRTEEEETPTIVKEIYDFINGKSFGARYTEQGVGQYGPTIYTSTLKLSFKSTTEFIGVGEVTMILTTETNSLAGGGGSNSDSNKLNYLIASNGNIFVGNMILTKKGNQLVSDQENGQGEYIIFRQY
jgi:hypothetical protein